MGQLLAHFCPAHRDLFPVYRQMAAPQRRLPGLPGRAARPRARRPSNHHPMAHDLLPEGEPLRAMTRAMGLGPEDIAGLVSAPGGDLAGALSFQAAGPDAGYDPI
jgi:serine/threonine-protein kinase HipA